MKKAEEDWEKRSENKMLLAELIQKVASHLGLREESILSGNRRRKISEARSMISYLAINDMGYSASEVARSLSISRVNAGRCAERGKKVLDNYEDLKNIVQ